MFGWFKKKKQAPEITAVHRLTPGKNLPDNYRPQLTERQLAIRELQRASNWPSREVSQERVGDNLAVDILVASALIDSQPQQNSQNYWSDPTPPVAEDRSCDYSRPEPVYDSSPSYSGGDSGYSGGDGGSSCSSSD